MNVTINFFQEESAPQMYFGPRKNELSIQLHKSVSPTETPPQSLFTDWSVLGKHGLLPQSLYPRIKTLTLYPIQDKNTQEYFEREQAIFILVHRSKCKMKLAQLALNTRSGSTIVDSSCLLCINLQTKIIVYSSQMNLVFDIRRARAESVSDLFLLFYINAHT